MRKFLILAIGAIGVAASPQAALAKPKTTCDSKWISCVSVPNTSDRFQRACDKLWTQCWETGYWLSSGPMPGGPPKPKPEPKPKPTKLEGPYRAPGGATAPLQVMRASKPAGPSQLTNKPAGPSQFTDKVRQLRR